MLTNGSAISLPAVHSREMKTCPHRNSHEELCIGILISAEGWKMDRICCSHTVTLSVTEVKDALIHDTLCEILKNIVLSEKSQTPKLIVCPFSAVTECMSSSPVKGAEMLPLTVPEAGMFSAKAPASGRTLSLHQHVIAEARQQHCGRA